MSYGEISSGVRLSPVAEWSWFFRLPIKFGVSQSCHLRKVTDLVRESTEKPVIQGDC